MCSFLNSNSGLSLYKAVSNESNMIFFKKKTTLIVRETHQSIIKKNYRSSDILKMAKTTVRNYIVLIGKNDITNDITNDIVALIAHKVHEIPVRLYFKLNC